MKVTIIFGSPRKNGNTASLLAPFMDELEKNGAEIEYFDVYEKQIAGCKVCLACQQDKTRMYCAIKDDMESILVSMAAADVIVFAAPIYLWTAPAPVKAVMDRSVYAACKYYGDDPHGPSLLEGKKVAVLTTCGYPVKMGIELYEEVMKRYCKYGKMIYAGAYGERQKNLKDAFMDEEKEMRAREFARKILKEA